jgi:hypothetical protein
MNSSETSCHRVERTRGDVSNLRLLEARRGPRLNGHCFKRAYMCLSKKDFQHVWNVNWSEI